MFTKMVCEHDRLKRAFVTLLLVLAKRYGVNVVGLTRDAPPADLQKAYRKVVLKCHPDKGGSDADQARLIKRPEAVASPDGQRRFFEDTRRAQALQGQPGQCGTHSA